MRVRILTSAIQDLRDGKEFYDRQEPGVGDYFQDCLFSDIDSLILYGGIHRKIFGSPWLLTVTSPTARPQEQLSPNPIILRRSPSRVWSLSTVKLGSDSPQFQTPSTRWMSANGVEEQSPQGRLRRPSRLRRSLSTFANCAVLPFSNYGYPTQKEANRTLQATAVKRLGWQVGCQQPAVPELIRSPMDTPRQHWR